MTGNKRESSGIVENPYFVKAPKNQTDRMSFDEKEEYS
jgi:hypothetical protein